MATLETGDATGWWLNRPLCRRYVAVVFGTSGTSVTVLGGCRDQVVQWALGNLWNGECELLGAWEHVDSGGVISEEALAKLHARGAEIIRFGVGDFQGAEPAFMQIFRHSAVVASVEQTLEAVAVRVPPRHRLAVSRSLRAAAEAEDLDAARSELARFQCSALGERYPEVVRCWSEALARFEPIYALHAQLRGLVRSADRTAADVRERLTRAILRHGPFVDSAAALDFVATSLARAERRLDREYAAAAAACVAGSPGSGRIAPMSGSLDVPALA